MRRRHFTAIFLVLACLLGPTVLHATIRNGNLSAPVRLSTSIPDSGVKLALQDLANDFERTFGEHPHLVPGSDADIQVQLDTSLREPESWTIQVTKSRVLISAADDLGAIYGIYEFSNRFLGVDPLWFWEDQQLPHREVVALDPQTLRSKRAAFRYRGWFINDEDQLCDWDAGGGSAGIRYPFCNQVLSLKVADRIYEALLRSGGNLIIPGSFINIMNPPEAALVQRAADRGLYVSQHHMEPLGMSYVGFEKYWRDQGEPTTFSYGANPEKVRETWRIYAAKWHEVCGNHVIWQLGLRGSGDKPVWASDPHITESEAGAAVSHAIADEWDIVRSVDPRPQPPATMTLWAEGSQLMRKKALTIPRGITIVFADAGQSQKLQEDFYTTDRSPDHTYGVYYHVAFWAHGPHLIQGTVPERLKPVFDALLARGDTEYAMVNVSNIRPFTLGIHAVMGIMQEGVAWNQDEFFSPVTTPALRQLYRNFLSSFVELPNGDLLQDGTCYSMIRGLLIELESRRGQVPVNVDASRKQEDEELAKKLGESISLLKQVVNDYPQEDKIPAEWRNFYDYNLLNQASMLIHYYACLKDLLEQADNYTRLQAAETEMQDLLKIRQTSATGQWENWYRGDKRENIPMLLERIQQDLPF